MAVGELRGRVHARPLAGALALALPLPLIALPARTAIHAERRSSDSRQRVHPLEDHR